MKNKINIISVCFILLFTFSCTKWLDVQPKSEIKSEVSFETQGGFKDALIGAYLLMTNSEIYGKEMSFGFIEALGQQFSVSGVGSHYYTATRYIYSDASGISVNYWAKAYNIIANLNNLLENLETKKSIFAPATYSVIKGEALGLRAYLHFDLLRTFGWGDLKNNPDNFNKLCIPYVEKYSKDPVKQQTVKEVLEFIKRDLLEAKQLLNDFGPYGLTPKGDDYFLPNDDLYFDSREKRFNFWASVCTLARVYLWEGDYGNAYTMADLYINGGGAARNAWIASSVIDDANETKRDLIFSTEIVFGLEISGENDLFKRLKIYIDPNLNNNNSNPQLMTHTVDRAKALYEYSTCGATDYRYRRHYIEDKFSNGYTLYKFWEVDKYSFGKRMPMIRKTEMYYIAAECLLSFGDDVSKNKALEYINLVRSKRAISPTFNLTSALSHSQIQNEITKEWQKEFISEGQMFFYYKRLGFTKIPNTSIAGSDKVYVLPLPSKDVGLSGFEDYK